jgi:hypothetical protein
MTTLFESLVRIKQEYCRSFCNPVKISDKQTIENAKKKTYISLIVEDMEFLLV